MTKRKNRASRAWQLFMNSNSQVSRNNRPGRMIVMDVFWSHNEISSLPFQSEKRQMKKYELVPCLVLFSGKYRLFITRMCSPRNAGVTLEDRWGFKVMEFTLMQPGFDARM